MGADDGPRWLSTRQACERLDITLRTLYRIIDEGGLPCVKFGRVYRILAADVDAFAAACRRPHSVQRSGPEVVFAADVLSGSWSRSSSDGACCSATGVSELIDAVAEDLEHGRPVAVGFCTPLSIPVPPTTLGLMRPRYGDNSPPWATAAGAERLVAGLQAATLVLASVRERLDRALAAGIDPAAFALRKLDLLVWEAVPAEVAGVVDVGCAAREAAKRLAAGDHHSDVTEPICISLAGAALAAAGFSMPASAAASAPWIVAVNGRPRR